MAIQRTLITAVSAIVLALMVPQVAYAGGVPTFDAANDAMNVQQLVQLVQQLQTLMKTLDVAKDQLKETEEFKDAVNRITEIANLAKDPKAYGYLANKASDLGTMASAKGVEGLEDLSGNAQKVRAETSRIKSAGVDTAYADYLKLVEKQGNTNAGVLATGAAAYDKSTERVDRIQKMLERLGSAQTSAEKEDLQVRVGAETAFLVNELTRLQAATMVGDAEARQLDQVHREEYLCNVNPAVCKTE